MLRNGVHGGASRNHADRGGHPARVVGQSLDGEDQVRRLSDRVAAVPVADPACARAALHVHVKTADALAGGDDLASIASRFGDQGKGGLRARALDQRPGQRRSDFFVGGD